MHYFSSTNGVFLVHTAKDCPCHKQVRGRSLEISDFLAVFDFSQTLNPNGHLGEGIPHCCSTCIGPSQCCVWMLPSMRWKKQLIYWKRIFLPIRKDNQEAQLLWDMILFITIHTSWVLLERTWGLRHTTWYTGGRLLSYTKGTLWAMGVSTWI